jgi:hypothetical protein
VIEPGPAPTGGALMLRAKIVEAARRWYRYGNEAELAHLVAEYERELKKAEAPGG